MIDPADASRIDHVLGLKVRMPAGWQFGGDCIYARLHEAGLEFTPPPDAPL